MTPTIVNTLALVFVPSLLSFFSQQSQLNRRNLFIAFKCCKLKRPLDYSVVMYFGFQLQQYHVVTQIIFFKVYK